MYNFYLKHVKKFVPRLIFVYFAPLITSINNIRWERKKGKSYLQIFFKTIYNKKLNNKDYFDFLFDQNSGKSDDYVEYRNNNKIEPKIKTIAFYLPQFHPVPENDIWWGRGFTEWTNVSKAVPQFIGHYQPKLPGELGFYDLRIPEIQKRQIELAKNYGIGGFCFYFYWFSGKRLLEKPLNSFLANKELNFPFCVNWANENWTRRWDGRESEVLMEQNYSAEDDINFIKEVSTLFSDERYIRIDGKPLLMVYAPALLPNAKETANRWRSYCREKGMGEIYLVLNHTHGNIDNPETFGFDAAAEFPPHNLASLPDASHKVKMVNNKYSGVIRDYEDVVLYSKEFRKPDYKKFRCIFTGWDNEARKNGKGFTFINSSPQNYKQWLENICDYTDQNFDGDEKIVFINAWNEWAEGTYLEPDRKFGYAYLQATNEIMKKYV